MLARWWGTIVAVVIGVLMVVAGRKATKMHARAEAKDEVATNLLNSGISTELARGKKMVESANKDKDKAVIANLKMKARLETLGEVDENIDDVADRFNSRRLHH